MVMKTRLPDTAAKKAALYLAATLVLAVVGSGQSATDVATTPTTMPTTTSGVAE